MLTFCMLRIELQHLKIVTKPSPADVTNIVVVGGIRVRFWYLELNIVNDMNQILNAPSMKYQKVIIVVPKPWAALRCCLTGQVLFLGRS